MYTLLGARRCEQNFGEAARLALGGRSPRDDRALKQGYQRFLRGLQPAATTTPGAAPEFVDDADTEFELLSAFVEPAVPNDVLDPLTPEVLATARARRDEGVIAARRDAVTSGRRALHAVAPGWARMVDLIVNRFFCVDIPHNLGGSSARAIGVVWVNTAATTTAGDMAEFLVHEATHHLAFLDDLLWGHYTPDAHRPEAVAVSAIRGVPRPVPCVFDSVLVSLEVLALRAQWAGEPEAPTIHPPSPALVEGTREAIASIRAALGWPSMFAPTGRMLLEAASERLDFFAAGLGG